MRRAQAIEARQFISTYRGLRLAGAALEQRCGHPVKDEQSKNRPGDIGNDTARTHDLEDQERQAGRKPINGNDEARCLRHDYGLDFTQFEALVLFGKTTVAHGEQMICTEPQTVVTEDMRGARTEARVGEIGCHGAGVCLNRVTITTP